MAVTRRPRPTPAEASKPAEQSTSIRRRRPAPAPSTAPTVKAIETVEITEEQEKRTVTDHERIVKEYTAKANTPKKAIRAKCIECMGGMIAEVNRCTSTLCPLYPFRLGKNPFHALSKDNKDRE